MSRYRREAELAALYGDKYPAVVVSQMGARKRDRKKLLSDQLQERYQPEPEEPVEGSYARGTFSSPQGWEQAARSGAQSRLFDPERSMIAPALRGMTSYGNLGHMFKGSSAGPGGNPFSTAGTPMAAPAPRMASAPGAAVGAMREMPPTSRGPDFHGLRTPGMGEMQPYQGYQPPVQTQRAPMPNGPYETPFGSASPMRGVISSWIPPQQDHNRLSEPSYSRKLGPLQQGPGGPYRSLTRTGNLSKPYDWKPPSYAEGTLPSYAEGTIPFTPKAGTGGRTAASQSLAKGRAAKAMEMIQSLDPDELGMALQEPDHAYRMIRERLGLGHDQASKVADAMIGATDEVARKEVAINGMIDSLMHKASKSNLAKFGKKAAGAIGKAGTFGVDALLDPMFGLLQNDPQGAAMLQGMGIGQPRQYEKGTLPSPSYPQMLEELLMGPSMDEAASPDLEPFVKAGRPDQALHAAFFGNLAKGLGGGRLGAEASNLAGFAREGLQGLGSAVTGGKFFGPSGFDTSDIRANMFGIDRATKPRTR